MTTIKVTQIIALCCVTLLLILLSACEDECDCGGVSGSGGMISGTGGAGMPAAGSGGTTTAAAGSGGTTTPTGGTGGTEMMDASTTNDGSTTTDTDAATEAAVADAAGDAVADAAPVPAELDYSDPTLWMCTPGAANNPCETDVQSTEVMADNTKGAPVPLTVKQDAAFDCFYVYPTMDQEKDANDQYVPGNHTDLTDVLLFNAVATIQAARFSTVCKVYAPYYRQMKIGSYQSTDFQTYYDFAYNDVVDAFDYYMANFNAGRNIVLIGHSQGSHLLTRLVSEKFDAVPDIRGQLISALLIGTSDLFVPTGLKVGGTFTNIPLCSSDTETGCVVAYNAVSAPTDMLLIGVQLQPPAGQEVACTNPAALTGGSGNLISYVSTLSYPVEGVATPTALFNNYFSAECTGTVPALVITPAAVSATELRTNPFDFATIAAIMQGSTNSLHMIDIDLAQGNLVNLVQAQGNAKLGL